MHESEFSKDQVDPCVIKMRSNTAEYQARAEEKNCMRPSDK